MQTGRQEAGGKAGSKITDLISRPNLLRRGQKEKQAEVALVDRDCCHECRIKKLILFVYYVNLLLFSSLFILYYIFRTVVLFV